MPYLKNKRTISYSFNDFNQTLEIGSNEEAESEDYSDFEEVSDLNRTLFKMSIDHESIGNIIETILN